MLNSKEHFEPKVPTYHRLGSNALAFVSFTAISLLQTKSRKASGTFFVFWIKNSNYFCFPSFSCVHFRGIRAITANRLNIDGYQVKGHYSLPSISKGPAHSNPNRYICGFTNSNSD